MPSLRSIKHFSCTLPLYISYKLKIYWQKRSLIIISISYFTNFCYHRVKTEIRVKFSSIHFQSGDLYDRYNSNVQEKYLIGLREGIQTPEIIYVTFDSSCFCVGCKKCLPCSKRVTFNPIYVYHNTWRNWIELLFSIWKKR